MSFLPDTFEKTIDQTTYRLDAAPMHHALLAAGVGFLFFATLVVFARRRRDAALVSPFVPASAVVVVGLASFLYATRSLAFSRGDAHAATEVFRDALVLDGLAAGVGLGAAIAGLLVLALRTSKQLRLVVLALPCAVLGVWAGSAARRHADAVAKIGSMPFYGVDGPSQMHVGRTRDVPVELMRPPGYRFWGGLEDGPRAVSDGVRARWHGDERVRVHPTKRGPFEFVARARNGPVTLESTLHVDAVAETASPLLSLRVGDRFVYRVRGKSADGAFLYFITINGRETFREVAIEVIGTRERDRYRTFVVELSDASGPHDVEVVAIDGETRFYDAEAGTIGMPVIAFTTDEHSQPDPVPCTFALLGGGAALCQRGGRDADVPSRTRGAPPVAFAGAAPLSFERSTSSTAKGIATAIVAIATIGLVILPDGSSSSSYALVSTHRGPEGAAEAPPG